MVSPWPTQILRCAHLVDVRLLLRKAELGEGFVLDLLEEVVLEELVDDNVLVRLARFVLAVEAMYVGGIEEVVCKALRYGVVWVGYMAHLHPLEETRLARPRLCIGRGALRAGVGADHGGRILTAQNSVFPGYLRACIRSVRCQRGWCSQGVDQISRLGARHRTLSEKNEVVTICRTAGSLGGTRLRMLGSCPPRRNALRFSHRCKMKISVQTILSEQVIYEFDWLSGCVMFSVRAEGIEDGIVSSPTPFQTSSSLTAGPDYRRVAMLAAV